MFVPSVVGDDDTVYTVDGRDRTPLAGRGRLGRT
jgi:hypothetical protein